MACSRVSFTFTLRASKGNYRTSANKLVTSEFIFRNNLVWLSSGFPAILSEVFRGFPRNVPGGAGKNKNNTKQFVPRKHSELFSVVVPCLIIQNTMDIILTTRFNIKTIRLIPQETCWLQSPSCHFRGNST
jgi:hypothetical protein